MCSTRYRVMALANSTDGSVVIDADGALFDVVAAEVALKLLGSRDLTNGSVSLTYGPSAA
ncbi:MAG: hypothetical protein ACRDHM_03520 [Actinomycetota bacterium]